MDLKKLFFNLDSWDLNGALNQLHLTLTCFDNLVMKCLDLANHRWLNLLVLVRLGDLLVDFRL